MLAVCVIDATSGPNTPLKIGPMITTADVVVVTKEMWCHRLNGRSSVNGCWRPIHLRLGGG